MLNTEQLAQFHKDGALVVSGALDAEWLGRVRADFESRADDLLARCGLAADGDFCAKMTRLLANRPDTYEHIDISLPVIDDMAAQVPKWRALFGEEWRGQAGVFVPPSVVELLLHPAIVGIAKQLLGDDIVASPVQHVRIKPPQRVLSKEAADDSGISRTGWHQDEAVVGEEARGADILTVWTAITEATPANGCMYYVAGSHLVEDDGGKPDFGLTTHCPGRVLVSDIYIPEEKLDKAKLRPLIAQPGDIVLLHRRTIHGAGANTSDGLRWSFDLRYQARGGPTGRDFFPSMPVDGGGGEAYRQNWLRARDDIIGGKIAAVFNDRWNKYHGAKLCA